MRTPRLFILSLAAVAGLTASASAQTPQRVLALTEAPLLGQIDQFTCNSVQCTPPMPSATFPWAGGTAHDPRDRQTWVSTGFELWKVDPRNSCNVACPPITPPFVTASTVITGLAFNEETKRLFISYSDNRIAQFDADVCAINYVSDCFPPVPTNHIITGLATEDAAQELYYATSPYLAPLPVPNAQVYRTSQFAPCAPLCPPMEIRDCTATGMPMNVINGLGFDSCRRQLFCSNGFTLVSVTNTWLCQPTFINCCPAPVMPDRIIGLCVLPSTEVSVGGNCFSGTAPACAAMQHVLRGDPTIGNLNFALDLVDAPAGSIAYVFVGIGPCAGPGTTFGGLVCGPVLPPTLLMATPTIGVGCNAQASIPFPIPNLPLFCGVTVSSQYAGQMPPGWVGSYVSNCLSWTITAS